MLNIIWSGMRGVVERVRNFTEEQLETENVSIQYHLIYPPAAIMVAASLLLVPFDGFDWILTAFLTGGSLLVTELSRIAYLNWSAVVHEVNENLRTDSWFIWAYMLFTVFSSVTETAFGLIAGAVVLLTFCLVIITWVLMASLEEYDDVSPPADWKGKIKHYAGKYYLALLLVLISFPLVLTLVLVIIGILEPNSLGLYSVVFLTLVISMMAVGYWVNQDNDDNPPSKIKEGVSDYGLPVYVSSCPRCGGVRKHQTYSEADRYRRSGHFKRSDD